MLKRGHNKDFALSSYEMDELISYARKGTTRDILVLLSNGVEVREVARRCGISKVAVWRRVKKVLIKASRDGVLSFEEDHIPFPEALRTMRPEPMLRERLVSLIYRLHALNGGMKDTRDPLGACPHADCMAARVILSEIDRMLPRQKGGGAAGKEYGESPRLSP